MTSTDNDTITNILHVEVQKGGADYQADVVATIARELHRQEQLIMGIAGCSEAEARYKARMLVVHSFAELVESVWFSMHEPYLRAMPDEEHGKRWYDTYQLMLGALCPVVLSSRCEEAIQHAND